MITYETFYEIFDLVSGEPEFELFFRNTNETYMIIKYENCVSFQRCGAQGDGSREFIYKNLDELYHSRLIDGICLNESWETIEDIILDAIFDMASSSDVEKLKMCQGELYEVRQ